MIAIGVLGAIAGGLFNTRRIRRRFTGEKKFPEFSKINRAQLVYRRTFDDIDCVVGTKRETKGAER
jgi:hypothetical protein